MPALLTGTDEAGRHFFDRGEVLFIDQRGARIRTRILLKIGAEVQVQLPNENETRNLRVVWRGEAGGFEAGMAEVEFLDPRETWNVETLRSQER